MKSVKKKKSEPAQKVEPLMESEDYADFIEERVRRAMANDRLLYTAEDIEDWLLDIGTSVDDLDGNQLDAVIQEMGRRMA